MANQKHEDELYIQEMKHKEVYYAEVQECNENVQNIKHDLKNQLGTLYDCMDSKSDFAKAKIKELFCELENVDQRIYTENAMLNSILKIKFTLAKERGIRTDVKVQVPINIMIDCGDLGIVYGNLLDNAIEACDKVYLENRYITLASKYIEGSLILIIKNCKTIEKNENLKTSKSDKTSHGRGIKSVKKVVEKYNGSVKFEDFGEDFEVSAIFYGI
ncbi:MAG: ATP-binding protein [Lachnotalea sp.]